MIASLPVWISDLGALAAVVVAVGAAATVITRSVVKAIRGLSDKLDEVIAAQVQPVHDEVGLLRTELTAHRELVTERLVRIEHEFHPNDGATMRDAIDRTEANTTVEV